MINVVAVTMNTIGPSASINIQTEEDSKQSEIKIHNMSISMIIVYHNS